MLRYYKAVTRQNIIKRLVTPVYSMSFLPHFAFLTSDLSVSHVTLTCTHPLYSILRWMLNTQSILTAQTLLSTQGLIVIVQMHGKVLGDIRQYGRSSAGH